MDCNVSKITLLTTVEETVRRLARGKAIEDTDEKVLDNVVKNSEQDYVTLSRTLKSKVKNIHWALENYSTATIDDVESLVDDPMEFDESIIEFDDKTPMMKYNIDLRTLIYHLGLYIKDAQIVLLSFQVNLHLLSIYCQHLQNKNEKQKEVVVELRQQLQQLQEKYNAERRAREDKQTSQPAL